jgi:hypothetical protein
MARFRLVQRDGVDTLHRSPSFEECQVDDAANVVTVEFSLAHAAHLVEDGLTFACRHCRPLDLEP